MIFIYHETSLNLTKLSIEICNLIYINIDRVLYYSFAFTYVCYILRLKLKELFNTFLFLFFLSKSDIIYFLRTVYCGGKK